MKKHLALSVFIVLLYFLGRTQNTPDYKSKMPATMEKNEPILVVTGKDNGVVDEWNMWFKGNGTSVYRLCTHRDEPIWGATPPYGQESMSSKELFSIRGSVLNLKVWEQLQFYVASLSASVVGSDENAAETYTIGDGLFETVYKSPGGSNTTSDKPPLSASELTPSAFAHAVLTRTASGAKLEIDGIPSARCGEESLNINSTSPIIKINFSNAELANWDRIEKTVSNSTQGLDGKGTYSYSVTVTATLPNVGVEIIGCTVLGLEEESVVTAKASKEGGTYHFRVEPREMFSIETNGSSATLRGSAPGRGTLIVEYTSTDGKKTEAKKEAACVNVESYNGGQKIPQIAFFDIDGKKLDGILSIPVEINPNDAADLLNYIPADPSLLTAVGLGNVVTLQGIILGKTTFQATTDCGVNAGPAVEVEVVNCDDETIARLEKMEQAAAENLKLALNDALRATNSSESVKARNDFLTSFNLMMAKIGLTILANGKAQTKFAGQAFEIADKGAAFLDIIGSSNSEEMRMNIDKVTAGETFERTVKSVFGEAVSDLYGKSLSGVIALTEVYDATEKFADNAVELGLYEENIIELMKIVKKANIEYDFVKNRQKLCNREKSKKEGQDFELADLKPIPQEQAPKQNQTPKTEQPPVQEPQIDQPTDETTPTDDNIIVDPEPPKIPPRSVGLPYEPDDCGCDQSKNLTVSAADFSTMSAGIENLSKCAKDFQSASLTDYQLALKELSELTGSLSATLQTDAAAFLVKAMESKPQLDGLVKRVKAYDEAGNAFLNKMEKCPESVAVGMEIFKSVEKITIDSIKTNY